MACLILMQGSDFDVTLRYEHSYSELAVYGIFLYTICKYLQSKKAPKLFSEQIARPCNALDVQTINKLYVHMLKYEF